MSFFIVALVRSQPVIEKVALPTNIGFLCDHLLPVGERASHIAIAWKRNQAVQMIRHYYEQVHKPVAAHFTELDRFEEHGGRLGVRSWFSPRGEQQTVMKKIASFFTHGGRA